MWVLTIAKDKGIVLRKTLIYHKYVQMLEYQLTLHISNFVHWKPH